MKKRYRFMRLSEDGFLKSVEQSHGYGYSLALPDYDSEEEALADLQTMVNSETVRADEYILVPVFSVSRERA